jgi:cyclopropane-fatty-acyl-phospholipid synthase
LDVGCGWGALLLYAIEHYHVRGVGVTPSRQQADYVQSEARRRGIADRLALHATDWRSVHGSYDRVVSVGMYEHVGAGSGAAFFRRWCRWLKPGGVSLLHTIGAMNEVAPNRWIARNIFPGGYLPSLASLAAYAAEADLVVADVENLWRHYAMTLAHWSRNFAAARDVIRQQAGERFVRTWWLYLNASEAAFRAGRLMLWQLLITRGKRPDGPLTRDRWEVPAAASVT